MNDDTRDNGAMRDYYKQFRNKKFTQMAKNHQVDVMVDHILSEMQKSRDSRNPLVKVSQLYVFKALFENSPMPRVVDRAIEGDILSFLTEILEREFVPSDDSNELLLYHLTMEILWLFSRFQPDEVKTSTISALLSEHLVSAVTKYTDINGPFYLFSPAFSQELNALCSDTCFQQQVVTAMPMTDEIWRDVIFYQNWTSLYGSIPHLHRCSLGFQPEGEGHIYSVALRLINDDLAWPRCPQKMLPRQSVSDFVALLINLHTSEERSKFVSDQGKHSNFTPMLERSLEEDLDPSVSVCDDVFFLNVLGGHYFWAYVGRSATNVVAGMSEMLRKELPHLKSYRPKLGDMVVAMTDCEDRSRAPFLLRGLVIRVREDEVVVFAVDYGKVQKVKPGCVYEMSGSASDLAAIQPQARLCCLSGVVPPPADSATVELALTFLTNVTKTYNKPGFYVKETGGVENLYTLIQTAPPTHRLQATRLLSNMASNSRLTKTIDWTPFIGPLLEMVMMLTKTMMMKEDEGCQNRNCLVASLYALTNIMYCKPGNQDIFFELYGHLVVLNVMRVFKCSVPITRAATGMLRTAYPGLMKSFSLHMQDMDYEIVIDSDEEEREEGIKESPLPRNKGSPLPRKTEEETRKMVPLRDVSAASQEQFSDEEINEVMAHLLPPSFMKAETTIAKAREAAVKPGSEVMPAARSQDSEGKQETTMVAKGAENNMDILSSLDTPLVDLTETEPKAEQASGRTENLCLHPEEPAATFDLVPVDGGSFRKQVKKYFEFNTYVTFQEDDTHHFLDHQDVGSIGLHNLTDIMCGMLNSKGGTIYIGLTKQGGVRGLRVTYQDRASLRLGIDNMTTRTIPVIPHTYISLDYVPVLRETTVDCLDVYKDVFIMEITLKAPKEVMFYSIGKDRVCYQRVGSKNRLLREQNVREMVATEEEMKYLVHVQRLRQNIQRLRQEQDS